ncbi:MAG: ROK family transcriptional regulator [Spirochaetales bacterium]|nr:ROK family transcriptional regulator [Spirochaetales bacterium]
MNVSRREVYGAKILSYLFTQPGLSRADLADLLQIDRGNLTRLVRELGDQGYIIEGEAEESNETTAGRKKIPLRLDDMRLCFLGIEVQETWLVIRGFSVYGKVLSTNRYTLESPSLGGDALIAGIARATTQEMEQLSIRGRNVLGVGIAISGLANPAQGLVLYSEHLGVVGNPLDLQKPLETLLKVPVAIDNDAKCCCYDVMTFGEFSDRQDFVYLFCELEEDSADPHLFSRVGIGSSLVLGGKVHYGANSAAGEFRSIFAPPGARGQFGLPVVQAIKRVRSDQRGRIQVLTELSQHLGFLSNYLDLEAIYLGGGIELYEAEMRPLLEEAIRSTWLYQDRFAKPLGIRFAENGDKPAVRGAAALIARKLFLV